MPSSHQVNIISRITYFYAKIKNYPKYRHYATIVPIDEADALTSRIPLSGIPIDDVSPLKIKF